MKTPDGNLWEAREDELEQKSGNAKGERLPRLAGHMAYWFGWTAFYPSTLLYPDS